MIYSGIGRPLCLLAAAGAFAALSLAASLVQADVTGEGDVAPAIIIQVDEDGDGTTESIPVPDLPIDGGVLDEDLIVGGTGIAEAYTTLGIVVIDVPAFTLPLEAPNVFIGFNPDGIGQVTVSGRFSELRVENQLAVGVFGQAWLDITGGALVTTNLLATGFEDAIVGQEEGSQGYVNIAGFGSKWRHNELIVGHQGYGELRVSDRGRLETLTDAIIGDEVEDIGNDDGGLGTGYVEVTGQGSRWDVVETLTVGNQGRGELQIRNGGLVRVEEQMFVGEAADTDGVSSRGVVVVDGPGSELWTVETLDIGSPENVNAAQGELHIRNGGRVRADSAVTVGRSDFVNLSGETQQSTLLAPTLLNIGTIRGSGRVEVPVVTNQGDIRTAAGVANTRERLLFTGAVNNTANIESVGGEIEFQEAVTHTGPDADLVGIDAIFRFQGGITSTNGANIFLDDTLIYLLEGQQLSSSGSLSLWAGNSTLIGDLELTGTNALNVELGEPSFGRIEVQGVASIAGEVNVDLADDYLPQIGDSFEIIEADSRTGVFDFISGGGTGAGFWEARYTGTSAILSYVADIVDNPLMADFDGNGKVNSADLDVWRDNFGNLMASMSEGDANGDGKVDGRDLMVIQRELGMMVMPATAAGDAAAGAVPEPSGLSLASLSVGLLSLFRRKRG